MQVAAGLVLLVEQSRLDGNQAATLQLVPGHVLRLADFYLERVPLQELGACPSVDEVCVLTGDYQSLHGGIRFHDNQSEVYRAYALGNCVGSVSLLSFIMYTLGKPTTRLKAAASEQNFAACMVL